MARRQIKHQKKPLIVICSEGGKKSSEYYYFRNFKSRNLRIQFSTGNSTDPKGMLKDLLKYIENEDIKSEENCKIFLVLDTDLDNKRINEIKEIEQECINNNIKIITSSPTFEIWYLLHFRKDKLNFNTSNEVKIELKKIISNYKETMDIYPIIYNKTNIAINNAKTIEKRFNNNSIDKYSFTPHSYIYIIIEEIINNS